MRSATGQLTSRATFTPAAIAAGIFSLLMLGLILLLFLVPAITSFMAAAAHFDRWLLSLLNGFARQSRGLDMLAWGVSVNDLAQGGVLGALFCGAWFATSGTTATDRQKRETLLSSLVGLYAAVLLALVLRAVLPFRARPVVDPAFAFLAPYLPSGANNMAPTSTSFPSGHATVYFAFAVPLLAVSTMLGIIAFLHVLVVVCLPRIYLGLHYPSDILGGAVISIATVLVVNGALGEDARSCRDSWRGRRDDRRRSTASSFFAAWTWPWNSQP
jgi:undecaprenyl-diphosphatase